MANAGTSHDNSVSRSARVAAREAAPWIEWLARFGYVAKGVVFVVVGLMACLAALGKQHRSIGSKGAIQEVGTLQYGKPLLITLAIGLAGFALFALVQALMDPEHKARGKTGIFRRIGHFASAVGYGFLAWVSVSASMGHPVKGDAQSSRESAATVMSYPFGPSVFAIAGVVMAIVGIAQIVTGVKAKFKHQFMSAKMSEGERKFAIAIGQIGHTSLGIVLILVGAYMLSAGRHSNPKEASGVAGAFEGLRHTPAGSWLLGAVAVGFVLYGVFMFFKARYRPIVVA